MSRIGQTYNAKNEKVYPKIVIGSIISDPSVDNPDKTNHAFDDAVGKVVSSELAKEGGVSFSKINLPINSSITNNGGTYIISVGQHNVNIQTNNFESTHIIDDSESLRITDANVSHLSVGDVSVGNIIVTNNSYDILKQYRELPIASSEYAGKVVQYIGPTHHENEDGLVCYSMVKCVMSYDASESLISHAYLMSDFDSFDSIITYKWLTDNNIKYNGSGQDKTYTFYLIWDGDSYIVEVENQNDEKVNLGGSAQSSYSRHIYCPYVWNTDFEPSSTGEVLSYEITFHTSTYVWKPQTPRKLETVSLQSISLSEEELPIYDKSSEYELYVIYYPANATNKKVTWESDNSSVVSVSNGIIQPHAVGTATITATSDDGSHKASCDVSVNPYIDVSIVEVSPIVMGVGTTVDANDYCTIVPDISELTEAQITYIINDESIADCSNGIIKGIARGDTSLIVEVITTLDDVSITEVSVANTITVYQPLGSITINPSTLELGHNSDHTIDLTIDPSTADINSVVWSSNSDIISVEPSINTVPPYRTTVTSGDTDGDAIVTCTVTDKLENKSTSTCDVTVSGGTPQHKTEEDIFTAATTGITVKGSYKLFEGKTITSNAVYAGTSAVSSNDAVQLRSQSPSGIVTTVSGGTVRKVSVVWDDETANGRTLNVYGSNNPYGSSADLYGGDSPIGTIVRGTSTELNIDGDYSYVGLRSNGSAMYLSSITITWEVEES